MSSRYNLLREIVYKCVVTVCDPCFPFKKSAKKGGEIGKERRRKKKSIENFA